jgi:DNA (cytosine-5)-methyltransferase 1
MSVKINFLKRRPVEMLRVFDVCAGIGGFSLGLHETGGYQTIAFCEKDPFCQDVLNKRFPGIPIFNDIKELANDPEKRKSIPDFDVLCAGVPCQPYSQAGPKRGTKDDRHLWPSVFEIIKERRPQYFIIENVAGFIKMVLDPICTELENEDYSVQAVLLPASSVQAPHQRKRLWLLGQDISNTDS